MAIRASCDWKQIPWWRGGLAYTEGLLNVNVIKDHGLLLDLARDSWCFTALAAFEAKVCTGRLQQDSS